MFFVDFLNSQFSHKQLVLVTAPVSTGAFLLEAMLIKKFWGRFSPLRQQPYITYSVSNCCA